ncbi:MAG: hypothetical protein AAFQ52_20365, partial [Chloroflexota bacterium]
GKNEKDGFMERHKLFIDIQFNGMTRRIQILDTQPDVARYEQVIPLPATRANNILYETIIYVDGIDTDEYEAKQLVVDILGSPIWRAKMLGTVHPMPHDAFWNIIFFIDQPQESHYTVLNAKYDQKILHIESRAGGQPAFLAIDRQAYPQEAATKIYEASGYRFSALTTVNLAHYQATIGMTQAVTVDIDIISQSIAGYLRSLRQAEAEN